MNRRGFLGALIGAVAGSAVLDPERLLWTPGKKLISIPKTAALSGRDAISVRMVRMWDPVASEMVHRLDVVYGFKPVPIPGDFSRVDHGLNYRQAYRAIDYHVRDEAFKAQAFHSLKEIGSLSDRKISLSTVSKWRQMAATRYSRDCLAVDQGLIWLHRGAASETHRRRPQQAARERLRVQEVPRLPD